VAQAPEDREMFCAKLVDLCKTCKVNTVEPLQEVMFDPTKHATFESESAGKASFTFRVKMAGMDGLALVRVLRVGGLAGAWTDGWMDGWACRRRSCSLSGLRGWRSATRFVDVSNPIIGCVLCGCIHLDCDCPSGGEPRAHSSRVCEVADHDWWQMSSMQGKDVSGAVRQAF
jgi:hypothetical protein